MIPEPVDAEIVVVEDADHHAGATTILDAEDIEALAPESLGDVLRRVPGVHVVPEDGAGLFPNIGVRGLPPSRSSKVLVLEDGVPIAPGPYGHPELYFAPPVGRIDHIEVVRGSGTVRFGPQTVGGVINLHGPPVPEGPLAVVETRTGAWDLYVARAAAGNGGDTVGWRVDAEHRRYGGPRGIDLVATDVAGRAAVTAGPTTARARFSWSEESARPSYLGLTTPQFEADPTTNVARNDLFRLHRPAGLVEVRTPLSRRTTARLTGYGQQIVRAWARQDWERSADGADLLLADSNNQRDRVYAFGGLEAELVNRTPLSTRDGLSIRGGLRVHHEHERQRQTAGDRAAAASGTLTADEVLTGDALSGWAEVDLDLADRLRLTGGLRGESLWRSREDLLAGTTGTEPLGAVLPGFGVSWTVADPVVLWGGVHRGWAPPATTDAITGDGTVLQLAAESSWNNEVGLRLLDGDRSRLELTGFALLFLNQLTAPSEAGVASDADFVNGDPTRHLGLELDARTNLGGWFPVPWVIEPFVRYTLVDARYTGGAHEDNRLPYAPAQLGNAGLRVASPVGIEGQAIVSHVGAQYADAANTDAATVDGTNGRIDPFTTLDAVLAGVVNLPGDHAVRVEMAGKNLTNVVSIGSRAPAGIQPVGFRTWEIALSAEW